MRNVVFSLGLPVLDSIGDDFPDAFVIRSRTEEEAEKKIDDLVECVSDEKLVLVYYIGYRPNRPVPTPRYFIEVEIQKYEPWDRLSYWFWSRVIRGGKKVG